MSDPASAPMLPLRIAVMTISDTRTEETDESGRILVERATRAGHRVVEKVIVKDERAVIEARVRAFVASGEVDVVIATGGTGITGRDVTPEAFEAVYEKPLPGFGELFRWISFQKIATSTIQSRATAGVAGSTYLFALPGSKGAVKDAWDEILVHQLDSRTKPCNFAELLPRLSER